VCVCVCVSVCLCVCVSVCLCGPERHVLIPKASRKITNNTPIVVPTIVIRAMVAQWEASPGAIR
jgi:hypothetical protein